MTQRLGRTLCHFVETLDLADLCAPFHCTPKARKLHVKCFKVVL